MPADDPDLLCRDGAQLRNVLHVQRVRYRRSEAHVQLHPEVRSYPDVESLGEVGGLQPWRYAADAGGVNLYYARASALQILAEVACGVEALPDRDGDAGRGGQASVAGYVFGWQRLLEPEDVHLLKHSGAAPGLGVGHRLVGVHHDVHLGADGFADGS